MKRRLIGNNEIVNDDLASRGAQSADVIGETIGTEGTGREVELRSRSQVVDDFQHRRPLTGSGNTALARQYRNVCRQFSGSYRLSQIVDTVGKDPDFDSHPRDAEESARLEDAMSQIAF